MDFTCFRCGGPGHYSADCPTRTAKAHPPEPPVEDRAPEHPSAKPIPEPRPAWQISPPTDEYLLAKAALGMPDTGGTYWRLLSVPCPWCQAAKRIPCVNRGTERRREVMHEARYAAALVPLPPLHIC